MPQQQAEYMTCTPLRDKRQIPLAPRAPSIHEPVEGRPHPPCRGSTSSPRGGGLPLSERPPPRTPPSPSDFSEGPRTHHACQPCRSPNPLCLRCCRPPLHSPETDKSGGRRMRIH